MTAFHFKLRHMAAFGFASALAFSATLADAQGTLDANPAPIAVPAQPLTDAIVVFNTQTGVRIVAPADIVSGVSSQPVDGTLTPAQALDAMLAGTGLSYSLSPSGDIVLARRLVSNNSIAIKPIVVTGNKIERSLRDTPTSVGIVTSEQIQDLAITDTFDSFNTMANVRRVNTDGGNDAFQIRGLNADGISEISNPATLVSLIIDGATQNSEGLRRGGRSTWDLEQIEVLRGPQSGLYGRAALAGAVVLKSKDPTYDHESAAQFNFGTPNATGGSVMVSAPIVEDQVAIRLSGDVQKEDKDITIVDPLNEPFGEDEYYNLRAKALVEPSAIPDLRALFTMNHAHDQTATALVSEPFSDRVFEGSGLASEGRDIDVNNYIADLSYFLTDTLTVRSISAFIDTDLNIFSAPGSPIFLRDDLRDGQDLTQDFGLEINDEDGSGLSGVIGAFYGNFVQETDTDIQIDLGAYIGSGPTGVFSPFQSGSSRSETESMALYSDLKYNIYGPISVLGGLRYQHDRVRNQSDVYSALSGTTAYDINATFDVWLPKIGLSYEINNENTVSAVASRGYRQGFTESIVGTDLQNDVDPENAWTYELSYRYDSTPNRLSVGANVFYNDYTDQQIVVVNPNFAPLTNTFNVGDSYSYGAEIEGRYDHGNGLTLFGSLGLLKTEINDLQGDVCASSGGNCEGNEFPEAPNVTAAFGGVYRHQQGYFVTADMNYTGSYFSNGDINNTDGREIDGRFLANASIGYEIDNFRAQLFVRNLLDEDYITSISSSGTSASIGDGRTVGAVLRMQF
ncbi:TonB-dependent receptor domain-containing protein [Nisaea nitritireducens]|uniref:TonB-dependent receptor domain-containing protein n=1 Tax=Nisaea nitritireducens TaxID=568392 RepID=UPI0018687852|nr:TonB-dependent receptor [Nisaea nitritireducens]